MTTPKYPNIVVQLTGNDGNAFAIMGNVQKSLRQAGIDQSDIDQYMTESVAGDYDHLLRTATQWVTVR